MRIQPDKYSNEHFGYLINVRMSRLCRRVAEYLELLDDFKRFIDLKFPEEESCHTRRIRKNDHERSK
jgi:hypothetical protein